MIPVKTMPRFKCDFCKKRGIARVIARHERGCYRNPNRFCDLCKNTGKVVDDRDQRYDIGGACPFCARFEAERLQEIEAWERGEELERPQQEQSDFGPDDIPF